MTQGYLLSSFARLLMGLLSARGITHLIASPGSRSTPYLLAAQRHGRFQIHSIVDERSAAYVALGLSRASGKPVALLCTSGTASANFLPAVVEAKQTATPLIVLTADRPIELYDCAAAQTVDQRRLYGNHVVASWDLTPPYPDLSQWRQLKRLVVSAVARATSSAESGPIHLNLHSPKPLEQLEPLDSDDRELCELVTKLLGDSVVPPTIPARNGLSEATLDQLVLRVEQEPNGLVAVGFDPERPALDPLALARFARASGYPVLLDATHPLRQDCPAELLPYVIAPFAPLLELPAWRRAQCPRFVIQVGRPLTSAAWERWLEAVGAGNLAILTRQGWPDPTGLAGLVANADPTESLTAIAERLESQPPRSSGWQARWLRAPEVLSEVQASALAPKHSGGPLEELTAVAVLLRALPEGSHFVCGNSLPVRHVDWIAGKSSSPRLVMYALRGASGIDGVISSAIGIALGTDRPDRPTTLLVGDISFLHDVGGLWAAQELQAPLAIVVLNNGGGRIFEQLPIGLVAKGDHLAAWTTPQALDLSHAAALYGLAYLHISSYHGLLDALSEAHSHPGATVIDVALAPHSAATQNAQLIDLVTTALEQQGLHDLPSDPGLNDP